MDKYDKLEKIKNLLDKGLLSEQEYEQEKAKILEEQTRLPLSDKPWGMDINIYCMIMHLALLFNFLGAIALIVMWLVNKDQFVEVNKQGKSAVNWLISVAIYAVSVIAVGAILTAVFPPFFILLWLALVGLAVTTIIFTVLAAVNANKGLSYDYPLSLKLIK